MSTKGQPSRMLPHAIPKPAVDLSDFSGPGSPDRSSKESMLSKMTQLTIPGRYSQGEDSITGDTRTTTALVQALDEDGSFFGKTVKSTFGRNRSNLTKEAVVPSTIRARRFLADNPDDWKTPGDWDLAVSTEKQKATTVAKAAVEGAKEEETMAPTAAKLETFHFQERPTRTTPNFQEDYEQENQQVPEIPAKSVLRALRKTRPASENVPA
ncbi:hypothetical protein VTI74DRAFT_4494 [Chaetomium olivicolor]